MSALPADDLILISVDDHICEPADMFDAHVPARYEDAGAPGRRRGRRRRSSGTTATSAAGTSGSTRSRASRREMFNVDAVALRRDAPRLLRRPRARARHVRRRPARRAELPELDRLLGPGAEPGARPRRQPRDDQGLQRLARRRVVRRLPRPVHPVRDPAAVRRATRRRRRCAGSPPRAATRSRSPRTPPALGMPSIHTERLGSAVRGVLRTGTVLCCHVGLVVEVGVRRRRDAPAACR